MMSHEDRKHLARLEFTHERFPIYFITTCVKNRYPVLDCEDFHTAAINTWKSGSKAHHWSVGPYTIMPDHVHFFCRARNENAVPLSRFIGDWKEWTSKRFKLRQDDQSALWQREFFDHIMRSKESLREKIHYVWMNPVRANLVKSPEDWQFSGNVDNWGVMKGN